MKREIGSQYDKEDVAFIERAIMGTMMGLDVQRDTPEARFLHLMDLSYLWADQEKFLKGVMAVWEEVFTSLDTKQFLELQGAFLSSYRKELVGFMTERKVPKEEVSRMANTVNANLATITEVLEKRLSDARVGAAAVITATTS